MAENEELVLKAPKHDKLGTVHCGVTREGFVSVGGDVANLADGEEFKNERAHVAVKRKGEEYIFRVIH